MSKGRAYFRVVVGGYLAYLGFDLLKDVTAGKPGAKMEFGIAGVLFMILGLVWATLAVKKIVNHEYDEEGARDYDEADKPEESEEAEAYSEIDKKEAGKDKDTDSESMTGNSRKEE